MKPKQVCYKFVTAVTNQGAMGGFANGVFIGDCNLKLMVNFLVLVDDKFLTKIHNFERKKGESYE